MQKLLLIGAAFGVAAAPVSAQTTPTQGIPSQVVSNQTQVATAAKPKTVKKTVCEKVQVEQSTGSRLGSTSRICRQVEVPVPQDDGQQPGASGPNVSH
jgi:hypothetical protein